MGLDWQTPFIVAFELFMLGLGWLLVIFVLAVFIVLTYAIIQAVAKTIRRGSKKTPRSGIITFDKK